MTAKEIKIVIDRVLGAVVVFRQGGSDRLILPKSARRFLKGGAGGGSAAWEGDEIEKPTFVLLATNKGLMLRPLEDYIADDEMKLPGPR